MSYARAKQQFQGLSKTQYEVVKALFNQRFNPHLDSSTRDREDAKHQHKGLLCHWEWTDQRVIARHINPDGYMHAHVWAALIEKKFIETQEIELKHAMGTGEIMEIPVKQVRLADHGMYYCATRHEFGECNCDACYMPRERWADVDEERRAKKRQERDEHEAKRQNRRSMLPPITLKASQMDAESRLCRCRPYPAKDYKRRGYCDECGRPSKKGFA